MLSYLKRAGMVILYHPVSHFAGMMAGGFLSLFIGAIFERHRAIVNGIVSPLIHILIPLAILFYIFQLQLTKTVLLGPGPLLPRLFLSLSSNTLSFLFLIALFGLTATALL